MLWPKKSWAAAIVAVLLAVVVFYAPVVPYSQAISIPGNYKYVKTTCQNLLIGSGSGGTLNFTTTTTVCLMANGTLPAVTVGGYGSVSYSLLGLGVSPYPDEQVVRQGNMTALVYFQHGRAVAAERFCCGQDPEVDPQGVVSVTSATITTAGFGEVNFSASVKNVGGSPVSSMVVFLDAPGLDQNSTADGMTWLEPLAIDQCYIPLQLSVAPGQSCTVSHLVNLPKGGNVNFHVEVRGFVNSASFVYRQDFSQMVPSGGVGRSWVGEFIGGVNTNRVTPLVENSTLDSFAAQRFNTASGEPDIADYNFTQDSASLFGSAWGAMVSEELLFPGGFTPTEYLSYLQNHASGHWSGLTEPAYSQFGYYVGQAPYYTVSANCPVQEIPGQGVNITQYFQSRGCTVTPVPDMIWLVIILAP